MSAFRNWHQEDEVTCATPGCYNIVRSEKDEKYCAECREEMRIAAMEDKFQKRRDGKREPKRI